MASAVAADLGDVLFWAGHGTNSAGLVIQWRDGNMPRSMMWGYRWNGASTGLDMLKAIVSADRRLVVHLGRSDWGPAILGIGYDLNDSGGFTVTPPLASESGRWSFDTGLTDAVDARRPSDAADHFAEGWHTGFWAYYLKDAPNGWRPASTGPDRRDLADGTWDGYVFATGFSSGEPEEPVPATASPYAAEVVAAQGPFGADPYDDPASVLGMPATNFYDPWGGLAGGATDRRVKLVEAAYNLDLTRTRKLITTLEKGSSIVVRFEQPIEDIAAHPYGIDFLVFGNSYYLANGFVDDLTDMNTLRLAGAGSYDPMKVSVSPGFTGSKGQDPTDPASWDWYRYERGPFADSGFPTQAFHWNRADSTWSSVPMDFTKPVNPGFGPLLEGGGISAADAIDLYDGSGGGTGFDLAESGFSAVRYVMIEGLADHAGGEIDAISAVRPVSLGDSLTIVPANLADGIGTLSFMRPGHLSRPTLSLTFSALGSAARVSTSLPPDDPGLAACGRVLVGAAIAVDPISGNQPVAFRADVTIASQSDYTGGGDDLVLLQRTGNAWKDTSSRFAPVDRTVSLHGVTNATTFALLRVLPPRLTLSRATDGSGGHSTTVSLPAVPGFSYRLERSEDCVHWVGVASISPTVAQTAALSFSDEAGNSFYRILMNRL